MQSVIKKEVVTLISGKVNFKTKTLGQSVIFSRGTIYNGDAMLVQTFMNLSIHI